METPEKIKNGLEHCIETGMRCHMCDYVVRCLKVVRGKPIMQDALALIQQLEADNASKDERIQMLEAGLAQWEDVAASPGAVEDMARENYRLTQELEAVKRERDAAVYALESIATGRESKCAHCVHSSDRNCFVCWGERWQWRGVCPENTGVRDK
jgi:hypothetical protein